MLKQLILACVASLTLLAPLTITAPARAHEPHHRPHRHCYHVYVRQCSHAPWQCAGTFDCREDAWQTARYYRVRGYDAFVR